ncbi:MAG: AMMECR1 domain-containing protein, partial [Bacteroidota bacterium]|nr:AMMECR1 domain-containing protein [Bacteroidota bacterium]
DCLLKIARHSIESDVKREQPPKIVNCPDALMNPSGAFVTIHTFKELCGCFGFTEPFKHLFETIF